MGWDVVFAYNQEVLGKNGTLGRKDYHEIVLWRYFDIVLRIINNDRYSDSVDLCRKYELFPALDDWNGKILILESSEEKPSPEMYEKMLLALKEYGIFDVVSGVLVGKPMDETYADEYKNNRFSGTSGTLQYQHWTCNTEMYHSLWHKCYGGC